VAEKISASSQRIEVRIEAVYVADSLSSVVYVCPILAIEKIGYDFFSCPLLWNINELPSADCKDKQDLDCLLAKIQGLSQPSRFRVNIDRWSGFLPTPRDLKRFGWSQEKIGKFFCNQEKGTV
jgi:hypothetical protein